MRFENQVISDQTVALDGNEFIDCTFHNCKIIHYGGPWSVVRLKYTGSIAFGVAGTAEATLQYLKFLKMINPAAFEYIFQSGEQPTPEKSGAT